MEQELTAEQRRQRFRAKTITRDVTRRAYIDCDCDIVYAQRLAEANAREELKTTLYAEYGSILGAIILAIVVNLISGWIADLLREWANRDIKSPALHWQTWEPGYEPSWEDDES
jgi:hypothetical protein